MKKSLKKNIYQRQLVQQKEVPRLSLKGLQHNTLLPFLLRWKMQPYYTEYSSNTSLTQVKRRCIVTNRSRGVFRFTRLSRIQLRTLASQGKLPGIAKINW